MTGDVIELRLPPNTDYLPVLRATLGVIAGRMSFNYDEIVQLRTAASEAFDMAIRYTAQSGLLPGLTELTVRFVVGSNRLELLIPPPAGYTYTGHLVTEQDRESQALLESLVDELEFGVAEAGGPMVQIVKYKRS